MNSSKARNYRCPLPQIQFYEQQQQRFSISEQFLRKPESVTSFFRVNFHRPGTTIYPQLDQNFSSCGIPGVNCFLPQSMSIKRSKLLLPMQHFELFRFRKQAGMRKAEPEQTGGHTSLLFNRVETLNQVVSTRNTTIGNLNLASFRQVHIAPMGRQPFKGTKKS